MATFITVEQEGSELLRRNKEQTQANRLNKVEGDEQRRTEQQAREARQQRLQQQGRDTSGNVVGDGRRRRFRMDEPAATFVPLGGVVISWDGIAPRISDRGAIPLFNEQTNQVPSTINGVPAIASASSAFSFGQAVYQLSNFPRGTSDFTLEAWGQCPVGGLENASSGFYITLLWTEQGNNTLIQLDSTYRPNGFTDPGNPDAYVPPGFYITATGSFVGNFEQAAVNVSPTAPFNLCIQRIQLVYYFYINGTLLFTAVPLPDRTHSITSPTYVYIVSQALNANAGSKISQLRLTTQRARYDINGFTPDPLPFRP